MRFEIKVTTIIDEVGEDPDQPIIAGCHADIGDVGSKGADIFSFSVCNLKWAEEYIEFLRPKKYGFYNDVLVLRTINEKNIESEINSKYLDQEYTSFSEFIAKVKNNMAWEYEDYSELR